MERIIPNCMCDERTTWYGLEFEPAPGWHNYIRHRFPGQDEPYLFFDPEKGCWFLADEDGRTAMTFSVPGNERTFLLWLRNKLGEVQARPPQRMICEIAPESLEALALLFRRD